MIIEEEAAIAARKEEGIATRPKEGVAAISQAATAVAAVADRSSSHDRGSQRRRGRSKSPSREEWDQAEVEDKQTHAHRNPTLATETGLVNAGFGSAATIGPGRLEGTF
jgi:hypothetical protein